MPMHRHRAAPMAVGIAIAVAFGLAAGTPQAQGMPVPLDAPGGHLSLHTEDALVREVAEHNDPALKNALSRTGETARSSGVDSAQAARGRAYLASQRALPDPRLTTARLRGPRHLHPRTRYEMAGGCYTGIADGGRLLARTADGAVVMRHLDSRRAARFRFQATTLGQYLLYGSRRDFLSSAQGVAMTGAPSPATEWTVVKQGHGFGFRAGNGSWIRVSSRHRLVLGSTPTWFDLVRVAGCRKYPESQMNIKGRPWAGVTPYQEVRGYVDAHTHGMAFEFLGGDVHCGRPWHKYGIAYALRDCPDHYYSQGYGAVLEAVLSGKPHHDPVGWPTFKDWPAPHSLTHEGTYYKWLERAWRGGLRLFTNLLVENDQLCKLYPIKHNSCDDMDSIRLQARDMHALQDYIDAQYGGPGRGWYRIVTNPWQARTVINQGKLAVIMGIETSIPFGCTMKADIPQCSAGSIDAQLAQVKRMGVRQMELVNKFDNALSGVAGDEGATGVAVNSANFLETGSFWAMRHCDPQDPVRHDKTQSTAPPGGYNSEQQDALFGAVAGLNLPATVSPPIYEPPYHCNARGLTDLGAHLINRLAQNHLIFDPDHMSVKGRDAALSLIDRLHYPGVISSHSWSTEDAYPRIYRAGGFITPYAGDSTGFVAKWRAHTAWADPRYYFGFGYGADINGLGAQGDPRGTNVPNPVTYPFRGFHGITVSRQVTGQRVFDINKDGVAQYGLYPDWIQDLTKVAGATAGPKILQDMTRGPEAYLEMWERAEGIRPDSCRNPGLRMTPARFRSLATTGLRIPALERRVGMPYQRLGTTFTYCAATPSQPRVPLTVTLSRRGRVLSVA